VTLVCLVFLLGFVGLCYVFGACRVCFPCFGVAPLVASWSQCCRPSPLGVGVILMGAPSLPIPRTCPRTLLPVSSCPLNPYWAGSVDLFTCSISEGLLPIESLLGLFVVDTGRHSRGSGNLSISRNSLIVMFSLGLTFRSIGFKSAFVLF
jgi:hypothetical protein